MMNSMKIEHQEAMSNWQAERKLLLHTSCSMQNEMADAEKERQETNIRFYAVEDKLESLEPSIEDRSFSLPSSFRGDWSINSGRLHVFSKEKVNQKKNVLLDNSSTESVNTSTTMFSGSNGSRFNWPKYLCLSHLSNTEGERASFFV